MKKIRLILIGVLMACFSVNAGQVLAAGGDLKKAKRYFQEGLYNEALKEYNDALTAAPDSSIINYGAGCANYKKNGYKEAVDNFNKGLLTEDKDLESKAYYNLGNSKYRLGESQENQNIKDAVSLYREAVEYYRKAIKNNSKDIDAKYNYEFAVKKLKAALEKEKQQSQQEQKQDKNKNQQKKETDNKQQTQEREQKQDNQEQKQQANMQQEQKQEDKGEKEEKQAREAQEEKDNQTMSKEEALMLIDRFDEQELGEKQRKKTVTYSQKYQDW